MPVLFISHSSRDDAHASALESWLRGNGFTDIFVDHHAIAGGEKWREALKASAGACRVVLCLVTANWLASNECFNEFRAAWYMGKRIIPLFLLPGDATLHEQAGKRLAEVCAEDQGIDLATCLDAGVALSIEAHADTADRLRHGLRAAGAIARVGLDPEAFAVDTALRPTPFPGLASFGDDDADAALFFGRSREIASTLEIVRSMRALSEKRPLVVLGASGAGKSSLLKAGIIPRLRREAPAWLPLRAFRPGADPLLNFAEAIARTLADFGIREAHGTIRDRLLDAWQQAERKSAGGDLTETGLASIRATLEADGHRLRTAAARPSATILISVDQAEEMARADSSSGEALADYLRVALASETSPWQLAFTIRTDSFPELQRHRRFQDLEARGYDLRAIPVFRFDSVVEEPAKRYGVAVDHALVDALMEDAPKEDALPLLAFALQRLWRQYAASGALTKVNYDKVGGLNGLIEDAAERALRGIEPEQDVPLPAGALLKRLVDLGMATFVPALVQINDQGATIRRVAAWTGFNDEQRELLLRFDRWRLVVRKGTEADGGTVEVAHEALFREWGRLKEWLEPERARLEALRSLQADAAAWERAMRDAAYLNHRDKRLAEVSALSQDPRYRTRMGPIETDYLTASAGAERQRRRRARQGKALVGALVLLLAVSGVGWWYREAVIERYQWHVTMRPDALTAERERALAARPGAEFRECAVGCPAMIVVPPGKFTMGSAAGKGDDDERPQHEVTIARPFAVGKFDVTFGEWDKCTAAGACPRAADNGWGRGNRPVINVTWDDAKLYTAWLSRMTGKAYRLLSEAEFEYAARAGTTTNYPWGDDIGKENANCSKCGSQWDGKQTASVGPFKPSGFGLFDMHGNVWKWVEDGWHADYIGAPTDGSVWLEGDASLRGIRGGSWSDEPQVLRSANRGWVQPDGRSNSLGFRLARTLLPPNP
jgi:formylglycine-generating enzyme required for sulfatase activity